MLGGQGLEPRGGELLPWVDTGLLGSVTPLAVLGVSPRLSSCQQR